MNATTAPGPIPAAQLLDLRGRTAVVTGAAMGIGLAIARRLHEAGANVVLADLDVERAAHEAAALEHRALAVAADVSDSAAVERLFDTTVDRFGAIDVLVNNAGIFPFVPMLELDETTWRRVLDVNLTGVFLCTRAAASRMVDRGEGGRILTITSIDAVHPSLVGLSHYDASKHGVWGFLKNVALELAPHGIWVNAIAPGGVLTPGVGEIDPATLQTAQAMIPMGRMGTPDDIARAALFLVSDLASYITGTQLVVDGGRLLR